MKLMNVLGMVLGIHAALFCVLLIISGCRSTPARAPEPAAAASPAVESVPENYSTYSSSSLTPVDSSYVPSSSGAGAPYAGLSPAERQRTEPTRPANPDAYISTDTPAALTPPPPEPATYVVRAGDSLWRIAKANGTNTAALQRLNPTLKADALRPGMMIKIPGTPAAPSVPTSFNLGSGVTSSAASATYIVRSGDSLSKIAARNGTTVAALRDANNLRSDVLQIGQSLVIPGGGGDAPEASVPFSGNLPPAGAPPPNDSAGKVTIVVQRGDTLGAIARKVGVTVSDLMAENGITDPTRVRIGQTLVIPGFQAVGTGVVPRTPPPPARTPPASSPGIRPAPSVDSPPPVEPQAPPARPPEFDQPDDGSEAPPIQPIDGDPMPGP